jgi:hypothetical protein
MYNSSLNFLSKHKYFIALILIFLISRYYLLFEGIIPFSFDHGKDSISTLRMILTGTPSLIGPWTSIPGLFFGPGWYYLIAPGLILFGFNPLGAVFMMVVVHLFSLYLAYKYIDLWTALIMGMASFWVIVSTSAWNPYPMILTSLIVAIILLNSIKKGNISPKQSIILGLASGFGFHFSTAYAIFYLPGIFLTFLIKKIKISKFAIFLIIFGVFLTFLPQIVFELRNDFPQTKGVIGYFQAPGGSYYSWEKFVDVVKTTYGEIKLSISPEIRLIDSEINNLVSLGAMLLVLASGLYKKIWKETDFKNRFLIFAIFTLLPIVGYFFLHFNVWYVYGILPFAVITWASIVKNSAKPIKIIYLLLLIVTISATTINFQYFNKEELINSKNFLTVKLKTIETIRHIAQDKPFASYHYVGDLYDFSYQYLYFSQAINGEKLPNEFSYQPNVTEYVPYKMELLNYIQANHSESWPQDEDIKLIFYIVEQAGTEEFRNDWWGRQEYSRIKDSINISNEITLFIAEPI